MREATASEKPCRINFLFEGSRREDLECLDFDDKRPTLVDAADEDDTESGMVPPWLVDKAGGTTVVWATEEQLELLEMTVCRVVC